VPAVSSSTTLAGPVVERGRIGFRMPDPEAELAGVRLCTDRGFPATADRFARAEGGWALTIPAPGLRRFEYAFEVERADGERRQVLDPSNPRRAPGGFGEKSVVELPGYAAPAWLDAPRVAGRSRALSVASSALDADVEVVLWQPADAGDGEPLHLLVAHDGPQADAFERLTDYAAAAIAAGRLPPHRIALLGPGDRDQWYSASALYARTLATRVLPAIAEAVAVRRVAGMGASLGALAMLHAHHRFPGVLDGLFLQSGSYFVPRFDSHEAGFVRYRRIVRGVSAILRAQRSDAVPMALTCGALEENVHNNRLMARALGAPLREGRDLHNHVAWRDAFEPHLTQLLHEAWKAPDPSGLR
jgi:enterochelin esterase family protein